MINLYIGTSNKGKLKEYQSFLSDLTNKFELIPILDLEVEEPYKTLTENAEYKAIVYSLHVKDLVIAEDSGFFVHDLNKLPGVYSARFHDAILYENEIGLYVLGFNYSIQSIDNAKTLNINRVLNLMKDSSNRRCYYHTALYVANNGKILNSFHGKCDGNVALKPSGNNGFGYDSIFIPHFEEEKTFAELKDINPNISSARGDAINQLKEYLNKSF